jgi:hypothetical protein
VPHGPGGVVWESGSRYHIRGKTAKGILDATLVEKPRQ